VTDLKEIRRAKGVATRARNKAADAYKVATYNYEEACRDTDDEISICEAAMEAVEHGSGKLAKMAIGQLLAKARRKAELKAVMEAAGKASSKAYRDYMAVGERDGWITTLSHEETMARFVKG
jgi:hypothetical protein